MKYIHSLIIIESDTVEGVLTILYFVLFYNFKWNNKEFIENSQNNCGIISAPTLYIGFILHLLLHEYYYAIKIYPNSWKNAIFYFL